MKITRQLNNRGSVAVQTSPAARGALHGGLVWSRRQPSSMAQRNQYDAAVALACARRRDDVTRPNSIAHAHSLVTTEQVLDCFIWATLLTFLLPIFLGGTHINSLYSALPSAMQIVYRQ